MTYDDENNICATWDVEFCNCNDAHIAHLFQQTLVCFFVDNCNIAKFLSLYYLVIQIIDRHL